MSIVFGGKKKKFLICDSNVLCCSSNDKWLMSLLIPLNLLFVVDVVFIVSFLFIKSNVNPCHAE